MPRPPKIAVEKKLQIVLSVLRGELTVAEAARRNQVSETSVAKWREQFVVAGRAGLEASATRGPSAREAELGRQVDDLHAALGEAHVELRVLRRGGVAGFASGSLR